MVSLSLIVPDSGKKVPDALSETIPIWCAVLNHLMLESQGGSDETRDTLRTSRNCV